MVSNWIEYIEWFCEVCEMEGQISTEKNEGLRSTLYRIENAHILHSPKCPIPAAFLRIVNPNFLPMKI